MSSTALQISHKYRNRGGKRKRDHIDEEDEDPSKVNKVTLTRCEIPPGTDHDVDESIGKMDPALLADHVAKRIKRFFPDLSTIELEDKYLPQQIFYDTTDFELPRKLDNLPSFLERFSGSADTLSSSSGSPGSPHTLVISASGLRASDVTRSLRKFQSPNSAVSKLFAKHIKLPEAVKYVRRTRIGIGVGTPQRLIDLLEKDVMKTENLKLIVVDGSHLDQKSRSVFDMRELLDPLIKLLSRKSIKDRLDAQDNRTRVVVF